MINAPDYSEHTRIVVETITVVKIRQIIVQAAAIWTIRHTLILLWLKMNSTLKVRILEYLVTFLVAFILS